MDAGSLRGSQSAEVEGSSRRARESVAHDVGRRDIAQRYDIDGATSTTSAIPPRPSLQPRHGAAFALPAPDPPADARRRGVAASRSSSRRPSRALARFRTGHSPAPTSLRAGIKAAKPSALVSVAVVPDPREAATHRLQDWRGWLDAGLVDVICPMAYTTDAGVFAAQIASAKQIAGAHPLWAGIGAYRLSSEQIVENAQTARRLGVGGIILFSYDSLADSTHGPGYVAQVGRAAFQF